MQTNQTAPHHPHRLSLPLSSLLSVSVCPNNFTAHTKWIFLLFYLQVSTKAWYQRICFYSFEALLFLFLPCSLSCALWWWRCLNLRGPSSSIPITALYLMSLKMHALLAGKNEISIDRKPEVENQLSWDGTTLGEGKHCAHWGTENCFGEGENKGTCAWVISEDIKLIH